MTTSPPEQSGSVPPEQPGSGSIPIFGAAPQELGGVERAVSLLEFDQIQERLAGFTRTMTGRERALAVTPSRDLLEIAVRQQETAESRQFLDQGGMLEFGPAEDLRELVQRAMLDGVLRGEELHTVQGFAAAAAHNRQRLSREPELPLLQGIAQTIPDLSPIERAVSAAISPAGEILDHASPALRQLRNDARSTYNQLNDTLQRSLRRFQRRGVLQEPIITQRNGRMVLLIRAEMKSQTPGIVHDVSDSGATVFLEPMPAIELGNRWREARLAEEREEERILRHLSALVGNAGDDLRLALDQMARLDVSIAKGRYSIACRGTAPSIVHPANPAVNRIPPFQAEDTPPEAAPLRLSAARHPLLSGSVVPISLTMSQDSRVLLITGPNAGGKTVALKTVGLLALMAHAGLHVPADEAQFPLLDGVYADIGDQQSIEQSLSTFSSHVQNLCRIMEQATSRSLALVDELGASTDPEEGSALAAAILGYLHRRSVLTVATTHHRGVAAYVQEQPGMLNASVDLDPQTLEPTYRVTLGLPGRSYAMTIAARWGMADEIVEHAQSLMLPSQRASEDLLRELREQRLIVERLRRESEETLAQTRARQGEVEAQLASVEAAKVDMVEEARHQLLQRVDEVSEDLQRAERALARSRHVPAAAPQLGGELRERRAAMNEARRRLSARDWQPIPLRRDLDGNNGGESTGESDGVTWQERLDSGDRVFIRGIPRPVEVITPPDDADRVEVLLGTMRAKIPVHQLERPAESGLLDGEPARTSNPSGFRAVPGGGVFYRRPAANRPATTELNLHGYRVEPALDLVEDFLNDAALDGATQVRIVHGKGTGALRRAIREHFTDHPLVAWLGPEEGPAGEGVTVVSLQ